MTSRSVSLSSQIILTLYLQVFMWLPLGHWNGKFDWINFNYFQSFAGYLLWALFGMISIIGFASKRIVVMIFGLIFHFVWLIMHTFDWWIPYIQGASPERLDWYRRDFGQTYYWLPKINNHWPPNAGHVVIDILLIVVLFSGFRYLIKVLKQRHFHRKQFQVNH